LRGIADNPRLDCCQRRAVNEDTAAECVLRTGIDHGIARHLGSVQNHVAAAGDAATEYN
jgi:hypothetical protein